MLWMMLIGMAWLIIFWGGIIWVVVWAMKRLTAGTGSGTITTERHSPLNIAKERYAKGEITREQFEQLKKDLS
jgi:putative membrane protein